MGKSECVVEWLLDNVALETLLRISRWEAETSPAGQMPKLPARCILPPGEAEPKPSGWEPKLPRLVQGRQCLFAAVRYAAALVVGAAYEKNGDKYLTHSVLQGLADLSFSTLVCRTSFAWCSTQR